MSIDATVGGATSNSYVTRSEADSYFSNRLYSDAWNVALSDTKDAALITATSRIEQEQYIGYRSTSTQVLSWPRTEAVIPDSPGSFYRSYSWFSYYLPTEIPQQVKDSVCEVALSMLAAGGDGSAEAGLQPFKSIKLGSIVLDMNPQQKLSQLPTAAMQLLRNLRITSTRVLRT
jgi:hypothetical protein